MSVSLDELQAAFLKLTAPTAPPETGGQAVTPSPDGQAVPAPAAPPPPPVQVVDAKAKGYHLDVSVSPDEVVAAAQIVRRHGFGMDTITGVDWMAAGQMEVVYDFFHPASVLHVVVRTRVPRDKPELPTILTVFPGANWHERETHDFFGIKFIGHPDLSPLLLPEDADYHPLRKDFPGAA
jgi:NADH-quinone oxidoreductase subunit C